MMTDVSIIIPTFNRLWSLPKAIESCRVTGLNIEIIVVNDGSTDDTAIWLKSNDSIVVINQENLGKDWAVNRALTICNGKYVRFLDADDWLLPYSTDELFRTAELHELDIICGGYQLFDEGGNFLSENPWTICDDFLAQQLGECDSSHYSAYLFKKKFIKDIPHRQEYGAVDDRQFIIECALKYPKTGFVDAPTLAHRVHARDRLQHSSGLELNFNHYALLKIYKKCFKSLSRRNQLTQRYKNAAAETLYNLARWIAITHTDEAVAVYDWVFELNPEFKPKTKTKINYLYRTIGFKNTEVLIKLARLIKRLWK